jgi:hypothetical protein
VIEDPGAGTAAAWDWVVAPVLTTALHCDKSDSDHNAIDVTRPQKRCGLKSACLLIVLLVFSYPPTMRWPRINRKSLQETDLTTAHPGSSDGSTPGITPDDPLVRPPPSTDPSEQTDLGLARMFSDAALYDKILTACPAALSDKKFFDPDDQALPRCIGGFNSLIGQDLGDDERAISGRMATLSVNNWSSPMDNSFASLDQLDEESGEPSVSEDSEEEKPLPPLTLDLSQDAPPDEPKLTPEEIVDLLEQEFGALGPPGEEKLLLEADAAFFKDVIILVGPSLATLASLL